MNFENLDIVKHSGGVISIKDAACEFININDAKWDFVFDELIMNSNSIFFKGFRLEFPDEHFQERINYLSESIPVEKDKYMRLLFKIKKQNTIHGRSFLNSVWNYYEYPAIFFLKSQEQDLNLISLNNKNAYLVDFQNNLKNLITIHKGTEPDVLWIRKSGDENFPTSWKI